MPNTIKEWAAGKTDVEAAEILGISQPFFNQIKNGSSRPSPELAERIEKITRIPFKNILLPPDRKTA